MTGIWRGLGSSTGARLRSTARAGSRSATSLIGASEDREAAISFLLDPSCTATIEPDGSLLIAAGGRPLARLTSTGPLAPEIVRGDETSNLGWVSPSFSVRVPADQIILKGNLDRPSVVTVTLLA